MLLSLIQPDSLDIAGSNMNGLKVFGEDALQKIKSCEFHF